MRRVVVHIDRLVLTGFRHQDRHAIAAGLQQELGRVLDDRDAVSGLKAMGDMPRLRINNAPLAQDAKPQRIGESVARGFGREIKK